ncbi:MAG: L-histidine N(alpha)-methyltransferase [Ectothiorhodospiraceae bacterium]|nr:L-histidine N(alpha)-methyltransferase [Ectothiorhodospiraceae bacterium]MCH8505839.1 L-histidine N(alpha)-methyltransferase [Ectothiorhodospiraceae bacterium]
MNATPSSVTPQPVDATFLEDVLAGLSAPEKHLHPKYFYDALGSQLFDRICELPEYYLTRTELAIMAQHGKDMGRALGSNVLLVEPGSGSSVKIRLLLDAMEKPAGYVPVEICQEHLEASASALQRDYPGLDIRPVCADFTRPFPVPRVRTIPRCNLVYFPGSTLGNFAPPQAEELLANLHRVAGPGGGLLLGVDLRKDPGVLKPAYDDAQGVTAAFNLNLLTRINRELGADFSTDDFCHQAVWNDTESRVEMHLVSRCRQQVRVAGRVFRLEKDEPIVTEYSYKYSRRGLADFAERTGFTVERCWTDPKEWFSVQLLRVAG